MKREIGRKMGIFIEAIEDHRCDGYDYHPGLSVFLAIADVCYPMHNKER